MSERCLRKINMCVMNKLTLPISVVSLRVQRATQLHPVVFIVIIASIQLALADQDHRFHADPVVSVSPNYT